jgi:hypothetical protein
MSDVSQSLATEEGIPWIGCQSSWGPLVQLTYTAWDRIVLNGYIERLQRPANLAYFFHEVARVPCITPDVLMSRTRAYRAWVLHYLPQHNIPLMPAPKGVRKEEVVEPYYRRLHGAEGVACVLTTIEQGRTFVSYTPRYTPTSQDSNWRLLTACRKRFLHYYFYVFDPVLGPMSLRVATFFPFIIACFLNGHSFLAQELDRCGVSFRKDDNAFLDVADVAVLQAAAERLTPAVLQQRCAYWVRQLAPHFSADERAAVDAFTLTSPAVGTQGRASRVRGNYSEPGREASNGRLRTVGLRRLRAQRHRRTAAFDRALDRAAPLRSAGRT